MSGISQFIENSFDAFARFLRLDDYPNQPPIVEWPMSEIERVELQTYEALAYAETVRADGETLGKNDSPSNGYDGQSSSYMQDAFQGQSIHIHTNTTIYVIINP